MLKNRKSLAKKINKGNYLLLKNITRDNRKIKSFNIEDNLTKDLTKESKYLGISTSDLVNLIIQDFLLQVNKGRRSEK